MTVDREQIRREAEDVIEWQRGPAKRTAEACLALLNERPTVDACIIAALETKLAEAEQERDTLTKKLERCETRLYLQRQRAELAERALAIETERSA